MMRDLAAEGITMLVVSYEMDFARSAASDIVFLDDGEVVEHGPPEQLVHDPHGPNRAVVEQIHARSVTSTMRDTSTPGPRRHTSLPSVYLQSA